MIKLAFCDDDLSALNEVRVLLDQYRVERNREIAYTAFQSPLELLSEVERGARFDVLLLDVLMPGQNGIDTAAELRRYDGAVKIIFLTSSAEFAVQSYTVDAYYYQLKPIREETFFQVLDSVLDECRRSAENSVMLRCKSGIVRVRLEKLTYCEVVGRTLLLHLDNGQVLESAGGLDKLAAELTAYENFVRPHRSYLVNMDHIQSISYRGLQLTDQTEIPIPHGRFSELKERYLEYAFSRKQVLL